MKYLVIAVPVMMSFCASAAFCQPQPQRLAPTWQKSQASASQAAPFRFDVREISVTRNRQTVFLDQFKFPGKLIPTQIGNSVATAAGLRVTAATPTPNAKEARLPTTSATYALRMGSISSTAVRTGTLVLDQTAIALQTAAGSGARGGVQDVVDPASVGAAAARMRWAAPANETTLACLMNVPIRTTMRSSSDDLTTFQGRELFGGLQLSTTFSWQQSQGWEKMTLGLTDVDGRRPAAKLSFRRDRIVLEGVRVENSARPWPGWIEVDLAFADLRSLPPVKDVTLSMGVDADGLITGTAKVSDGHQQRTFTLKGSGQYAKLDPSRTYAIGLYTETLPKALVSRVNPDHISAITLTGRNGRVWIEVFGRGFGPDTHIDLFLTTNPKAQANVSDLRIARHNNELNAQVDFPSHGHYSLRLTTAGQSALLADAIAVE